MLKSRLRVGIETALACLAIIFLSYSLTGCDGIGAGTGQESTQPSSAQLELMGNSQSSSENESLSEGDVEFVRVVTQVNKNGDTRPLLMISLQKTSKWRNRLGGLRILPRTKDGKPVIIRDDGKNGDARASDGIYSGFVDAGCIPDKTRSAAGKRVEFECTVLFVGPGHDCGEFGTCPSRVSRSIFWGLIEYETDIVFCVCLSECTGSN